MSINVQGSISINAGIEFWLGQTIAGMSMWIKEFEEIAKEIKEGRE